MKDFQIIQRDLSRAYQNVSLALDRAVVYNLPTRDLERVREQILSVIEKL